MCGRPHRGSSPACRSSLCVLLLGYRCCFWESGCCRAASRAWSARSSGRPHFTPWVRTVDGWERPELWAAIDSLGAGVHPLVVAAGQGWRQCWRWWHSVSGFAAGSVSASGGGGVGGQRQKLVPRQALGEIFLGPGFFARGGGRRGTINVWGLLYLARNLCGLRQTRESTARERPAHEPFRHH